MALTIRGDGALKLSIKYVHKRKADGTFFYYRRVPADLKEHYPNSGPFIRRSLGTKDPATAAHRGMEYSRRDDLLWSQVRSQAPENPLSGVPLVQTAGLGDRLRGLIEAALATKSSRPQETQGQDAGPVLSEVVQHYLDHHPKGRVPFFVKIVQFGVHPLIDTVGDLPIREYTRAHARQVRDYLLADGNRTTTVRRRLRTIIAVFNHGISEHAPEIANVFSKLRIPLEGADSSQREPFTERELMMIANACRKANDDIRHLAAILLDTGARLAEIVGLQREDLKFADPVPHIAIREDLAAGRSLKNSNSARRVPLVGLALWGAQRALEQMGEGQSWVFPRYAEDHNIRATHASNTLAKWLRSTTGTGKTAHCFRHAMRDRLRAAGVPQELQDLIGGWGTRTVGQSYGLGYPLGTLRDAMGKVVLERMNPLDTEVS